MGIDGTVIDDTPVAELPAVARGVLLGKISDDGFVFRKSVSLIREGYRRDTMSVALGRLGATAPDTLLRLPSRETVTTPKISMMPDRDRGMRPDQK